MKLQLLGTGGVTSTPRPTCQCNICIQAREKGVPYERTTCSMFVHGINLLFDVGEDSCYQLNKREIQNVEHLILTHWHPDHTHGIRVLEQINWSFEHSAPRGRPINVYISKRQRELFEKHSCGGFLSFYEKRGMIEVIYFDHLQKISIEDHTITPYYIEKPEAFYFGIEHNSAHCVYAMCEYEGIEIYNEAPPADLFIAHCVFWENNDELGISPRKTPPKHEDTFTDMLGHADKLKTKNIILTHIEESFGIGYDELNILMKKHYPEYQIRSGYDGMYITI